MSVIFFILAVRHCECALKYCVKCVMNETQKIFKIMWKHIFVEFLVFRVCHEIIEKNNTLIIFSPCVFRTIISLPLPRTFICYLYTNNNNTQLVRPLETCHLARGSFVRV